MNLKFKLKPGLVSALLAVILITGLHSCKTSSLQGYQKTIVQADHATITEKEVLEAQKSWGEGIVRIGKVFLENGDYKKAAAEHIETFYNYDDGVVLFKPTLVYEKQFRTDFEGALSYFVAGNERYPEDHGFAIKPWSKVRWENTGVKSIGNMAVAMGNYYFTPAKGGDDVKVEYSFAYTKNKEGKLKIILHDSHIPYSPH